MEVAFADLDKIITDTLNQMKEASRVYREKILSGMCTPEEYKHHAGVLVGIEMAAQTLQTVARKQANED